MFSVDRSPAMRGRTYLTSTTDDAATPGISRPDKAKARLRKSGAMSSNIVAPTEIPFGGLFGIDVSLNRGAQMRSILRYVSILRDDE
jgi:hypothetical protein